MRHIRPFDPEALSPGQSGPWLLGPEEDAGCTIRLRRGGGTARGPAATPDERYALVIGGEARLQSNGAGAAARAGEVIFIPAGQAADVEGGADAVWVEIQAPVSTASASAGAQARVIEIDQSRFAGEGFAHQSLVDRTNGAQTMRLNTLQVAPGAGSPDFHIHAFGQIYVILDGEMTVDVGRARLKAPRNSVVYLPPGSVHRNFNASGAVERHVSLLVPEPLDGEIFDYAITIHEAEAELLTAVPA